MTSPLKLAEAQSRRQKRISKSLVSRARTLWGRLDRSNLRASWLGILPELLVVFEAAQLAAASEAEGYVSGLLAAQGIPDDPFGAPRPGSVVGVASDGRALDSLLYQPMISTLEGLKSGAGMPRSLNSGWVNLEMIARTQVADAFRAMTSVGNTNQRHVSGYVRQIVGATCGRCVILAGRWYRWSSGFDRHPRCDCIHIPAREDVAGDLTTDPMGWFNSLSKAEQDKQFTKAGAQAIRDGADISRVVNSRRGAYGLSTAQRLTKAERASLGRGRLQTQRIGGRDLFTTTEATTRRGINRKVRLMPESIYSLAKTREEAVDLLKLHGYIL